MMSQFKVNREQLKKWVSLVGSNFKFNNMFHEYLNCLKFEVSPAGFYFYANDDYSVFRSDLFTFEKSDVEEEFDFLIDAVMLQKILSSSRKEFITFKVEETTITLVTESRNKLPILPADSFPIKFPALGKDLIDDASFFSILDTLSPLVSKDLSSPHLMGVGVSDQVYVGATDGGQWGAIHKRVETSLQSCVLFPYTIKFINSILSLGLVDPREIRTTFTDTHVCFNSSSFRYATKRPEVNYPFTIINDVFGLVNKAKCRIKLDNKMLHEAIKRVTLFDKNEFSQIKFSMKTQDAITIATDGEWGRNNSASEVIEVIDVEEVEPFVPLEFVLMTSSIRAFKKLFGDKDGEITLIYVDSNKPLFIKMKGMKYLFYSVLSRKV